MLTSSQLAPLDTSYPLPGMLSHLDRPVRWVPAWAKYPLCPASVTLGYLLANLYPEGTDH